eukprot:TRINITY_DN6386_c0_g1_i3.p1 TRINITY_DN6386_c0_g1~~TRINITY_DN6386_c0_g1_i3.p1  ORF type:complete len:937 (+),score=76.55 TRINITY_DN6386_c0_g1_i3:91-2901(+)
MRWLSALPAGTRRVACAAAASWLGVWLLELGVVTLLVTFRASDAVALYAAGILGSATLAVVQGATLLWLCRGAGIFSRVPLSPAWSVPHPLSDRPAILSDSAPVAEELAVAVPQPLVPGSSDSGEQSKTTPGALTPDATTGSMPSWGDYRSSRGRQVTSLLSGTTLRASAISAGTVTHDSVSVDGSTQFFDLGAEFGVAVWLHLADGGLQPPAHVDSLAARDEERLPLWRMQDTIGNLAARCGGRLVHADPIGGTALLCFVHASAESVMAASLEFADRVPKTVGGFRLTVAVGPPGPLAPSLRPYSPLSAGQVSRAALLLHVCILKRERMICASTADGPQPTGYDKCGFIWPDLTAWEQLRSNSNPLEGSIRCINMGRSTRRSEDTAALVGSALAEQAYSILMQQQQGLAPPPPERLARMWARCHELALKAAPGDVGSVVQEAGVAAPAAAAPRKGNRDAPAALPPVCDFADWHHIESQIPEVHGAQDLAATREDLWFSCPDMRIYQPELPPGLCVFGVIDGHSGRQCAEYAQAHALPDLARRLAYGLSVPAALQATLQAVDRCFTQRCAVPAGDESGACITVVVVTLEKVVTANLGDCRAVGVSCTTVREARTNSPVPCGTTSSETTQPRSNVHEPIPESMFLSTPPMTLSFQPAGQAAGGEPVGLCFRPTLEPASSNEQLLKFGEKRFGGRASQHFAERSTSHPESSRSPSCAFTAFSPLQSKWSALRLSTDHSAAEASERGCVEAVGGSVIWSQGAMRVDGKLQVSRSLGDFATRICRQPDVAVYDRTAFEAIVVGSDGLWDVVSDLECATIVGAARDAIDTGESVSLARSSIAPASDARTETTHPRQGCISPKVGRGAKVELFGMLSERSSVTSLAHRSRRLQSVSSMTSDTMGYGAIAAGLALEARDRANDTGRHQDDITVVIAFLPRPGR